MARFASDIYRSALLRIFDVPLWILRLALFISKSIDKTVCEAKNHGLIKGVLNG